MSDRGPESTYPYLRKTGVEPLLSPGGRQQSWRSMLVRALIGIAGVILLLASVGGFVAYKEGRRNWDASYLLQLGAGISYWHQLPAGVDSLPPSWREMVGDQWWSDIEEVTFLSPGYWNKTVPLTFHELTEADIKTACNACGRFSRLRRFQIASDFFTCSLLSNWSNFDGLEELEVNSSRLRDADLQVIGQMKGLKRLRISQGAFSTGALGGLSSLPLLESLTLHRVSITDSGSIPGKGFPALRSLVVGQSHSFGDEVIRACGPLLLLEDVNFIETALGDEGLKQLLVGGKVRSLIIDRSKLTDNCFATLARHPAPKWLVLSGMLLSDGGLAALQGKAFPTLIMDRCNLTDEAFRSIARIDELNYLILDHNKISGTGVDYLPGDKQLDHLDLSGSPLSTCGIAALAKVNCKKLSLSGTSLTDDQLMVLANNEHLRDLDVSETNVTEAGIRAFYSHRMARSRTATWGASTLILQSAFPDVVASILGVDPETGEAIGPAAQLPAASGDDQPAVGPESDE